MRTKFVKIFSTLLVGTGLFMACRGGKTAPIIKESYKGALSVGDFIDIDFNSEAETLTATITEGKYVNQKFAFTTKWMSEQGQHIYSIQKDGRDVAGFLAAPRFIISSKITMDDGSKRFFVAVPNVQDVSFDKLKNKVYNYVALTTNQNVSYGTFKILNTNNNKRSQDKEGKDVQFLQNEDINASTSNSSVQELFITKENKTFAVYKENSDTKVANFIPRVEADGKIFFVIDFTKKSSIQGVGFAINQEKLENSSFKDGKYDIATGDSGVTKGTQSGNTFTGENNIPINLEQNKPWTGMAETKISGTETPALIGFPVNGTEFYGITISKANYQKHDGFIAIKVD